MKRGEFKRCKTSDDVIVLAFCYKVLQLHTGEEKNQPVLFKLRKKASNIVYEVMPGEDKVSEFFYNFQAGEDAQRVQQDAGNSVAFRRMEKLVCLQMLLLNENEKADAGAIADRFNKAEASGKLTYSSADGKIGGHLTLSIMKSNFRLGPPLNKLS